MRVTRRAVLAAPLVLVAAPDWARAADPAIRITRVAAGFSGPWALAFLPGGGFLVTERRGRLWSVSPNGEKTRVKGLPKIAATGQGGLLDVLVPRDFASSREILFTFSRRQGGGQGTALAACTLSADGTSLTDLRLLFEMTPGSSGGRHFGSRLVEASDGRIFMTVGERGDRPSAQDLGRENGSVLRLNRDGSIPRDNPFVGQAGARPAIWSYGHRNPQGAALDGRGRLWVHEHGARGGDEVNRIRKGANYGWPVIAYGRHYSGERIGEGTAKPGMEQPEFYWDPSIAPSGLAICSGRMFPGWRGHFLVGSLKFNHIAVLTPPPLRPVTRIATPETARVRDVREAPDGSIWFISEDRGAVCRITPDT